MAHRRLISGGYIYDCLRDQLPSVCTVIGRTHVFCNGIIETQAQRISDWLSTRKSFIKSLP